MSAALAAAAIVLAACTVTVDGRGTTSRSPSSDGSRHAFPSGSPVPTKSAPSATGVPSRFARTPTSTEIGDPPRIDFCSPITISDFAQPGYTPKFEDNQFPPGCGVDLVKADGSHVSVSVFTSGSAPVAASGRTKKIINGLVVYVYPFQAEIGECERDVVAGRITLTVNSLNSGATTRTTPVRTVNCAATDLMAETMAAAVAHNGFKELKLASPSVTDFDACAIVKAAGWMSLPTFETTKPVSNAFDAGCRLSGPDVTSLYVDPVISTSSAPDNAKPVTVANHTIYVSNYNTAKGCNLVSVQGRTGDGRTEWLTVVSYTATTVPRFCTRLATAVGRYLTLAGLR